MNRCFLPLLFTPALALAQELPDEDWVCITTHYQESRLFSENNTLQNFEKNTLPNYIFNPARGYRPLESNVEILAECAIHESISGSDEYVCNRKSALGTTIFQLNAQEEKFNYVTTIVDEFGHTISMLLGNCNKI